MKAYAVQFAAVAERHIDAIGEWWEARRPGAPELFKRELAEAVQRLADAPHSGSPYPAPRPAGTRRLLLRKTGYHVYYTIGAVDLLRTTDVTVGSVTVSVADLLPSAGESVLDMAAAEVQ